MNTDKIYAEHLANEYAPKDTSKVVALRKLDARAKLPATVFTYAFGIAAALVTGVGMCLSMEVIHGSSCPPPILPPRAAAPSIPPAAARQWGKTPGIFSR